LTHPNQHDPEKRRQVISSEYDEPFEDVVRGFRQQGAVWSTIAGALDVPVGTLRKWAKKLELLDGERNEEHVWTSPLEEKAKSLGYEGVGDMIRVYHSFGLVRQEVADTLKCHKLSLSKFAPPEVKENPLHTQKQSEARRKTIQMINARRHANYQAHQKDTRD
jgi:hypothetical protein